MIRLELANGNHASEPVVILLYSAAMTLIVANTFGTPGYVAWASVWAVIVYRKASRPPGEDTHPTKEKERFVSSSSSDSP